VALDGLPEGVGVAFCIEGLKGDGAAAQGHRAGQWSGVPVQLVLRGVGHFDRLSADVRFRARRGRLWVVWRFGKVGQCGLYSD
jgi:hypothetical protein